MLIRSVFIVPMVFLIICLGHLLMLRAVALLVGGVVPLPMLCFRPVTGIGMYGNTACGHYAEHQGRNNKFMLHDFLLSCCAGIFTNPAKGYLICLTARHHDRTMGKKCARNKEMQEIERINLSDGQEHDKA